MSRVSGNSNPTSLIQRAYGEPPIWLHRLLRAWYTLIVFVVLALAGNILVVPLARGLDRWWPNVVSQVNALVSWVRSYPIPAGGIALLVTAITVFGYLEDRRAHRKARRPIEDLIDQVQRIARERAEDAPAQPEELVAPTGLPRPASLVGRDMVLAQLEQRLIEGGPVGVFAVEGMGGVGKTAVAAEAVAHLSSNSDAFPGGAAWVSCEELSGAEGLATLWGRVARAFHLGQVLAVVEPDDQRVALVSALAQHPRVLLALDNVEPGLDVETIVHTLAVPRHVVLLLTAREAILPNIITAVPLPPLAHADASALFAQRLAQTDPDRPTEDDSAVIPALVDAVGGLPLALELAAAYAGIQHAPLSRVLAMIQAEGPNARSLGGIRSSFDRSWRVLTPQQQRLCAGLSLIAGASFPRAAADTLALTIHDQLGSSDGLGPERDVDVLVSYALLEPLADQPLRQNPLVRLHPLLRQYAAVQLSALPVAEVEQLGDSILAYWLRVATMNSEDRVTAMDALDAEAAGLMGALTWAHNHQRCLEVLAMARELRRAWYSRGRRRRQLRMYDWAIEAAEELHNQQAERWALHQLGVTQFRIGLTTQARGSFERALDLARRLGDQYAERTELHHLAVVDARIGLLEQAREGYERALHIARHLERRDFERLELHGLAVVDARMGRLEEARRGYELALSVAQERGNRGGIRADLHGLAVLETRAGHEMQAREIFEQALQLSDALHDPALRAVELQNYGAFLGQHGDLQRGRQMIHESLELCTDMANFYRIGRACQFLAWLDRDEGNIQGAVANYREALRYLEPVRAPAVADVLADLQRLEAH